MPNQTLVLNPDQLEVLSLRVRAMPCLSGESETWHMIGSGHRWIPAQVVCDAAKKHSTHGRHLSGLRVHKAVNPHLRSAPTRIVWSSRVAPQS